MVHMPYETDMMADIDDQIIIYVCACVHACVQLNQLHTPRISRGEGCQELHSGDTVHVKTKYTMYASHSS